MWGSLQAPILLSRVSRRYLDVSGLAAVCRRETLLEAADGTQHGKMQLDFLFLSKASTTRADAVAYGASFRLQAAGLVLSPAKGTHTFSGVDDIFTGFVVASLQSVCGRGNPRACVALLRVQKNDRRTLKACCIASYLRGSCHTPS